MLKGIGTMLDSIVLTETRQKHNLDLFRIMGCDTIYSKNNLIKNNGIIAYIKGDIHYEYNIMTLNNRKVVGVVLTKQKNTFKIVYISHSSSNGVKSFSSELHDYFQNNK